MIDYDTHTEDSAPDASRTHLARSRENFGGVLNLFGNMAESPSLLQGYLDLSDLFENSSLSPSEQTVVLLTVSRFHECTYCMAAHSVGADMKKIPVEITDAIRNDRPIPASRFEALRRLTRDLVEHRGWPDPVVVDTFFSAGFTKRNLLDLVLGIGLKTMSNYTNHLAGTQVDEPMKHRSWEAPADRESARTGNG